jgi:hypothetical protein
MQLRLTKDPVRQSAAPLNIVLEGPTKLTPATNDVTIASYNIENFPGDLQSSNNDPAARAAALARHIVNNMKSPVIVAIQELQVPFPIPPAPPYIHKYRTYIHTYKYTCGRTI